jgi:Calcium binding
MDMDLSARKLDKMIEEATVDCYDELEQASGFYTMIEDHLAVPFATQVLCVEVSVVGVEMDDNGSLKAVCERNGKRQLIGLIDLQCSPRRALVSSIAAPMAARPGPG